MRIRKIVRMFFILSAASLLAGACCWVDEDLSECAPDFRSDYELRLVTNVSTEIETKLNLDTDVYVANSLRKYLSNVFTDLAHDIDLSFYDPGAPYSRLEHKTDVIDANQTTYTFKLPARDYMNTCVANLVENGQVDYVGSDMLDSGKLLQAEGTKADEEVTEPHGTGLFSARKELYVKAGIDQHFEVTLYMVNCATALVLDTSEAPAIKGIRTVVTGFASEFSVADSTYAFLRNPLVRTEDLQVEGGTQRCFASVHFPSRDTRDNTKVVIETEDPFLADDAGNALWQWKVYVTIADGSVTESVINMTTPVRAGGLRILKAKVYDTGIVTTEDPTVSVSVALDWGGGGSHEVPL